MGLARLSHSLRLPGFWSSLQNQSISRHHCLTGFPDVAVSIKNDRCPLLPPLPGPSQCPRPGPASGSGLPGPQHTAPSAGSHPGPQHGTGHLSPRRWQPAPRHRRGVAPSRPRTQPQWMPRRGRAGPQLHSLPRPPALGGLWNSTFLRRVNGAGLCRWLNSSLMTTGAGRAAGRRRRGPEGAAGGGLPASPARRQAAEMWLAHTGLWAAWPGHTQPRDRIAVYAPVCPHACPGSHTPRTQGAGARPRTCRASGPSVGRPGPAGRAREASPTALGPAPLPAFRSAPPSLSGQPGSQAQEGGQEWPEGRACGLRPPATA